MTGAGTIHTQRYIYEYIVPSLLTFFLTHLSLSPISATAQDVYFGSHRGTTTGATRVAVQGLAISLTAIASVVVAVAAAIVATATAVLLLLLLR